MPSNLKAFFLQYIKKRIFAFVLYLYANWSSMKKVFFYTLLLFFQFAFSQQNQLWQGYFSYNEIKDVSESPTRIFAAAENALFSKDLNTNDIKTTNTINGLSGQTITMINPVS